MMSSFNGPRRGYEGGYEDRYDPRRFEERGGQSFERSGRGNGGDWMREPRWASRHEPMMQEAPMVKVIEVLAQSPHSWEDATRRAISEASRTIRGIRSVYIKDMQAVVEDDQVMCFRINAKISFALDPNQRRERHQERMR
jgi:flavin-binding protein dodecin